MKRTITIIVFIAIILALGSWALLSRNTKTEQTSGDTIPVAASFYPLAFLAEQVGGDTVEVTSITPSGSEPHEYEPTPQEIISVQQAKVFIYNGAGLDPWAEDAQSEVIAEGGEVIRLSDQVALLPPPNEEEAAETPNDPHFWLDPVVAQMLVEKIRDALITADPAHADMYRQNAATLDQELAELDSEYRTGLSACQRQEIFTSHAAFGYLAKRYGLTQVSISGVSPEEEPSAGRLAELAQEAKQQGITTIFFETLVSPDLAETLANEVGAATAVLDPIEGISAEDAAGGATYLTVMRQNLQALREALSCS